MEKYDLSIVIPVYNAEETIMETIESIQNQNLKKNQKIEVLMINDGSEDNSKNICLELESKYENFKYLEHENRGVSYTRNKGIEKSSGKYIMFLDSDDKIKEDTVCGIIDQFNKYENEADLLAIPLFNEVDGRIKKHGRFKVYEEDRLVDLEEEYNFNQTTINVVIKKETKVRFNEELKYGEDALFNIGNLIEKKKIIVSSKGGYVYRIGEYSAVKKYKLTSQIKNNLLLFFEECIKFKCDEKVPKFIQSSILYEINWRFRSNNLFPNELNVNERKKWDERFENIFSNIEKETILRHNKIDYYHKMFFIERKLNKKIFPVNQKKYINFYDDQGDFIAKIKFFTFVFHEFKVSEGKIKILSSVKSPFLNHLGNMYVVIKRNGEEFEKIALSKISNLSRYKNKDITNIFYLFEYQIDLKDMEENKYEFKIECLGQEFNTTSYMMEKVNFKDVIGLNRFDYENKIIYYRNLPFRLSCYEKTFKNELVDLKNAYKKKMLKKEFKKKMMKKKIDKTKKIWIYNDRLGIFDNAYMQFKNDFSKKDNVERYYITYDGEDIEGKFSKEEEKHLVVFGSKKHKEIICEAEYIITSFQAEKEYLPFYGRERKLMNEMLFYKVVYLQHGILHAHTPWIYSKERSKVDYFLTSSKFEKKILTSAYNYKKEDLIELKMPRFSEKVKENKKERKILFAPSWRYYFTKGFKNFEWQLDEKALLDSDYYKNINLFLNNEEFIKYIEKENIIVHFELHPIFKGFGELFEMKSKNIIMVNKIDPKETYGLFITDFSSFVYDFVYYKTPIKFFIPDVKDFLSGNHLYNKIENEVENDFGEKFTEPLEIINSIKKFNEKGFEIEKEYIKKYEGFFNKVDDPMNELYNFLTKKEAK